MRFIIAILVTIICSLNISAQTSWSKDDQSHPLNGIWYLAYADGTYHPVLDVYSSGGRYTVNYVGRDIFGGEFRNAQITGHGDICEIMVEVFWDHHSELRKKGWTYYVEDCDEKADPGYSKHGSYKYDRDVVRWYYKVDLSIVPLTMEFVKVHTDYYLKGIHTYSETDSNPIPNNLCAFDKELTKK
ncbi:MAG: hypothetical protein NC338_07215 [Firmicutes bacterium]|nr:hypothetical protein [Bacillota bacterium]MCM1401784.1 hypothetical protein [Bacteroides sp.]MCM1477652.1 hypothetical protein [Bacteroides sp.]